MLTAGAEPSTVSVGLSIVRNEGVLSLYKGINAALLRAMVSGGGRLTGYNALKSAAARHGLLHDGQSAAADTLWRSAMAVASACSAQLLAAPVDLVRTRQAVHSGDLASTPGTLRVVREVVAARGVAGLFAGSSALMVRAVTFNIAQLLTYDHARRRAGEALGCGTDAVAVHVVASLAAGFAATTASAPAENIKTVLQVKPGLNFAGACRHIVGNAGWLGFWRGWTPLYAKLAPHTLVVFVVLEQMRMLLGVETPA